MTLADAIIWIENSIPGAVATHRQKPGTWTDAIEVETVGTGLSRHEVESRLARAFDVQHVFSGTVAVVRLGTDQGMDGAAAMAWMSSNPD